MTVDVSDFLAGLEFDLPPSGNSTQRKQALETVITDTDIDKLLDLNDKLSQVINQITANDLSTYGFILTPDQAEALMIEELHQKEIRELLDARREMRKRVIFRHITSQHVVDNTPDPDFAPGEIPVPAQGKKFARQGGRAKFVINEDELKDKLGPLASQVFRTRVVPAYTVEEHVETEFDEEALASLIAAHPHVMETLRECVTQKGRTPMSLNVRDCK